MINVVMSFTIQAQNYILTETKLPFHCKQLFYKLSCVRITLNSPRMLWLVSNGSAYGSNILIDFHFKLNSL